jgi:hypothetical protein
VVRLPSCTAIAPLEQRDTGKLPAIVLQHSCRHDRLAGSVLHVSA